MAVLDGNLETSNPSRNSDDASASSKQQLSKGKAANGDDSNNGTGEQKKPMSLAELFGDSEGNLRSEDDVETEQADDPSKPPTSVEAVAKRLSLKPEQVYAIKVPMPNGAEALTVGQLKDRVGELVDLETREMEFDQRRTKQEGELLRAQQEMREVLAQVPKDALKPELLEKARTRHEATMRRERQLTLEHIPAWSDENRRTADMQGMMDFISEWGFDGESFLPTLVDHRAIKFVRDMWLRDQRIKKALENVKIPLKKGQRPSSKAAKAPVKSGPIQRRQAVQPDQRTKLMDYLNQSED